MSTKPKSSLTSLEHIDRIDRPKYLHCRTSLQNNKQIPEYAVGPKTDITLQQHGRFAQIGIHGSIIKHA